MSAWRKPQIRVVLGMVPALASACTMEAPTQHLEEQAGYVGAAVCATCHEAQQRACADSLHAAAMRPARPPHVHATFTGEPVPWAPAGRAIPRQEAERLVVFARAIASSTITLDPAFAPAAYTLGVLYGYAGRWADAIESLEACLEQEPAYPGTRYDLALAHLATSASTAAIQVLEAAVSNPRTRTEALRGLVAVHLTRGDRATARRWAQQARPGDPALAADPRIRALFVE